jgi:quercetin dioxygenase-like cupin family protein
MRRVVVGYDASDHQSKVVFDGPSPHLMSHSEYDGVFVTELWHVERGDVPEEADLAAGRLGQRPRRGASRFYAVEIAAGTEIPSHGTPTVDYHCVIAGEITCLLDGGEVTVRAGDVLVLQGNQHGWSNRGTEPFKSVAVMVNAESE